ncbi:DUF1413 domain-containing protein [Burkholderia sp. PAMC 26561]|uniref:DUF1413 domain-containing protein n=1 Tax=Burkholderia sp. PAMC 26561 TaxID=1795043 RepID=UPI000780A0A2|nr:DUF1413 domain-containing protein [Burkholderia sp. PAMC 26561]
MKILIDVEDSLLGKALNECETQNVSFDRFVTDALRNAIDELIEAEDKSTVADTVAKAIEAARAILPGNTFHLDDICSPDDWSALNGGERKILGKAFRKAVETGSPAIARHIGRTSGNKAIYERV